MGLTREKKPSKRSMKASQQISNETTELPRLEVTTLSESRTACEPLPIEESSALNRLHLAKPSAKSSRSSLKTDRSAISISFAAPSSTTLSAKAYDPLLIEVIATPDRGYAVFTTSRVPAGTLILAERPLIRLTAFEEAASASISVEDALTQHFYSLPKPSQKTYMRLCDSQKSSFSRIKSIYFSNCYDLGKPDTGSVRGGSVIGLLASRINHSCIPNVQFSFADIIPPHLAECLPRDILDVDTGQGQGLMLFYTLRNLPAHRELLSNYDSIYMTTEQRQVKQQMYYGFRCNCEACTGLTDFWGKSDERRREMSQLEIQIDRAERKWEKSDVYVEQTEKAGNTGAPSAIDRDYIVTTVLPALERLAILLTKEGIAGVDLAQAYRALSTWSIRANQPVEERLWLKKEYDACVLAFGEQGRRTF